jgi:hypothetical protein
VDHNELHSTDQWRREGVRPGTCPRAPEGGAPKEGGSSAVPAKGATNMTFSPGRQKPWRRHCNRHEQTFYIKFKMYRQLIRMHQNCEPRCNDCVRSFEIPLVLAFCGSFNLNFCIRSAVLSEQSKVHVIWHNIHRCSDAWIHSCRVH